mmetsp:Transcript_37554/g.80109  ORF Transcript_37554/g.80109 Transcript_37554/m.80109 type:complete len:98 (-) Transcript_37554:384-677(-)
MFDLKTNYWLSPLLIKTNITTRATVVQSQSSHCISPASSGVTCYSSIKIETLLHVTSLLKSKHFHTSQTLQPLPNPNPKPFLNSEPEPTTFLDQLVE